MLGQLVSVDDAGRITLPTDLLAHVDWWPRKQKALGTAELCDYGQFRLYKPEDVAVHIERLREQITNMEPALLRSKMSALDDRYRALTIYADGRLQMTKEVAAWVSAYPFPSGKHYLFVEAFPAGLSICTQEYRAAAQARAALPTFDGYLRSAKTSRGT